MQKYLQDGKTADGVPFAPLCYIKRVDEPDFGCEGRPEGDTPCAAVLLVDPKGERTLPIREDLLFQTRLDDKMWVAEQGGTIILVDRRGARIELNGTERTWLRENRVFGCETNE